MLSNRRLDPTWCQERLAPGQPCLHVAAGRRPSFLAPSHPVGSVPLGPTRLKRITLGRHWTRHL